jgi:hypothetical protein
MPLSQIFGDNKVYHSRKPLKDFSVSGSINDKLKDTAAALHSAHGA